MNLKTGYSAQELTDLQLNSLPQTRPGVTHRAKKDCWPTRKRSGRGGGIEYLFEGLPAEVQIEIKAKFIKAMMPKKSAVNHDLVVAERDISQLSSKDREQADCKALMALLVREYEVEMGRSCAISYVSQLSREQALPIRGDTDYNVICEAAKSKKRGVGVGTRVLHKWVLAEEKSGSAEERLKRLAPKRQGQPVKEIINLEWMPDFMAVFCTPNGLSVAETYRKFSKDYAHEYGADAVPHYDAVRRALAKLPAWVREHKRLSGSAMRGLRACVRREWNAPFMQFNDVWVGDGHSVKCRVRHPMHGQPFTPELTIVMDAVSRYIVGWSIAYSESQIAVGDALRYGMERHGIPAIYYSDNGSGQKNKTFDTDVTGVFARLGINHATGIPGNPQGRGIIERQMKEVPKRVAQSMPTYYGSDADPEYVRKMLSSINSLSKALSDGKANNELTPKQAYANEILPSWHELIAEVEAQVYDYNHNRIHSVIGTTPAKKRGELLANMNEKDIVMLTTAEARDLFRPSFERVVQRGEVRWENTYYQHEELERLDKQKVVIYVDQHDPSSVIVRDIEGRYLCEAVLSGTPAFAQNYIEKSQDKRVKAQIRRKEDDIAKIKSQNRQTIEHEKSGVLHELFSGKAVETVAKQEYAMFAIDLADKAVNDK